MRTPIRKGGKYVHLKPDPYITRVKFDELNYELNNLKTVRRPPAIQEVKRLAAMGDFSDNTAYQMAKGRLRWINQRIIDLENWLKRAVVIEKSSDNSIVQLGHYVTVETSGKQKTYQILGSSETGPSTNVISHNSPLGSQLIGRKVGDSVRIETTNRLVEYVVIKIE